MKTEMPVAPALRRSKARPEYALSRAAASRARLTRILVPVDFSVHSQKAMAYALALAARAGSASVHLMHVVEPLPLSLVGDAGPAALPEQEVAAYCEHELARLAYDRASPGLPISSAVHAGQPSAEIIAVAKEMRSDLVVISSHGRTGLEHLLLGSVAERVVREAPCPVLVVREGEREFVETKGFGPAPLRLRKILVSTDFSPRSEEALRYAVEFSRQFGGRITLFHSVFVAGAFPAAEGPAYPTAVLIETMRESAQKQMARVVEETEREEIIEAAEVRMGPPLAELPALAKSGGFDLVVCATRGLTGVRRVLLGSTAEAIVRHAPCPVLVVRIPPPRTYGPRKESCRNRRKGMPKEFPRFGAGV
jgi:nucleotide-binding universal stress UspA family protein